MSLRSELEEGEEVRILAFEHSKILNLSFEQIVGLGYAWAHTVSIRIRIPVLYSNHATCSPIKTFGCYHSYSDSIIIP